MEENNRHLLELIVLLCKGTEVGGVGGQKCISCEMKSFFPIFRTINFHTLNLYTVSYKCTVISYL